MHSILNKLLYFYIRPLIQTYFIYLPLSYRKHKSKYIISKFSIIYNLLFTWYYTYFTAINT